MQNPRLHSVIFIIFTAITTAFGQDIEVLNDINNIGKYYIAISQNGSVDTIDRFNKETCVMATRIDENTVELILKTMKYYNFLVIEKNGKKWQSNKIKSGQLMPNLETAIKKPSYYYEAQPDEKTFRIHDNGMIAFRMLNSAKIFIPKTNIEEKNLR